jgi:chromate transporter
MFRDLFALILSFGKIGLVSLGGGNSMLKLIEHEAVQAQHWINQEEFVKMIGSSFLFPGLTAVKLSALIGYKTAGISGLLLAVISLNLPGLLMATVGYYWLTRHDSPFAHKLMQIVQYGALALLAAATYSIAYDVIIMESSFLLLASCILFFIALAFFNTPPFLGFLAYIGLCFVLIR